MSTHEPETYPAKHYNSQMLVMLLCEFCYTQLYATRGRTSTPTIEAGQFCQPCQVLGDALLVAQGQAERETLPVERCGLLIVAHSQDDGSQVGQRVGDV